MLKQGRREIVDNYNVMLGLSNSRKAQLKKNDENWKLKSRERLEKIVASKMTTLMIGALAAIEEYFGDLWGNGEPNGEFEQQCYKDWLLLRNKILDMGNKGIRTVKKETQQYEVEWVKYQGIGFTGGKNGKNEI